MPLGLRGSGAAGSSHMLVGLPAAAAARPAAQEHASRGELLLSVFMEFWLADGDCPLPGAPGGGSGPNTPKRRSSRDGWKEYNDSWGGLLSAPSSSLRRAPETGFIHVLGVSYKSSTSADASSQCPAHASYLSALQLPMYVFTSLSARLVPCGW